MELISLSALQLAAADTIVTIQVRGPVAQYSDLAILVAAASLTVVAVYVVRAMAQFRRALKEVRAAVQQNLGPVSDRARSISENVQFISQAVRTDVERLNASVKALTARLHQASDRMEERIEEFNALMEVVQGEAEDIFLDTAATVRGVREGARSLGRRGAEPLPASVAESDALAEVDEVSAPVEDGTAVPGDR